MQSNEKRYVNLLFQILKKRPKKILEIGVYNGKRAIQMIEAAKSFNNNIEYYGFDLFEEITSKIHEDELSKFPDNLETIKLLLDKHAKINLFKGFTKQTLKVFYEKKINVDFIFIDGGHSVETIENDYFYCSKIINKKGITIMDDFYESANFDLNKYGSNNLYKKLKMDKKNLKILPFEDKYKKKNGKVIIKMFAIYN